MVAAPIRTAALGAEPAAGAAPIGPVAGASAPRFPAFDGGAMERRNPASFRFARPSAERR
jgi:hypothetical protein